MEPSRPQISCTYVRRLCFGRTIFFGPEAEQSFVHLILIRLPHAPTRLPRALEVDWPSLNFRCMPHKFRPTIFVPAEENPNG
jgi:hypothetical protein